MTITIGHPTPGIDRPTGPTTERRCPGCRNWYEKRLGDCPGCGEPRAGFNATIRLAQLNNHLLGQADHASRFS